MRWDTPTTTYHQTMRGFSPYTFWRMSNVFQQFKSNCVKPNKSCRPQDPEMFHKKPKKGVCTPPLGQMKSYVINETGSTTGLYFGDHYVQPKKKARIMKHETSNKKTATDFQNPSFSGTTIMRYPLLTLWLTSQISRPGRHGRHCGLSCRPKDHLKENSGWTITRNQRSPSSPRISNRLSRINISERQDTSLWYSWWTRSCKNWNGFQSYLVASRISFINHILPFISLNQGAISLISMTATLQDLSKRQGCRGGCDFCCGSF